MSIKKNVIAMLFICSICLLPSVAEITNSKYKLILTYDGDGEKFPIFEKIEEVEAGEIGEHRWKNIYQQKNIYKLTAGLLPVDGQELFGEVQIEFEDESIPTKTYKCINLSAYRHDTAGQFKLAIPFSPISVIEVNLKVECKEIFSLEKMKYQVYYNESKVSLSSISYWSVQSSNVFRYFTKAGTPYNYSAKRKDVKELIEFLQSAPEFYYLKDEKPVSYIKNPNGYTTVPIKLRGYRDSYPERQYRIIERYDLGTEVLIDAELEICFKIPVKVYIDDKEVVCRYRIFYPGY